MATDVDRSRTDRGRPAGLARTGWPVALALITSIYVLRLDRVCGLYVDDAWYVLLGKALASGKGYQLINSPTPGILPFYPPGFPSVLSLVFRIAPAFPENVWLLKAVSIAAMLAVAVLTRRYCVRDLGLGWGLGSAIAVATALHPGFVYLATATTMSECVFMLAQMTTVVLVERVARGRGGVTAITAGGVAAFAFLTRSMAIGLIVAAGLYLLKERRWRGAAAFALGVAVVAGPWVLHARAHAPTPTQQAEVNDYITCPYATQFWMNVAGHPEFGMTPVADLPARAWRLVRSVATRDIGALAVYPIYRLVEPGDRSIAGRTGTVLSLGALVLGLIGFVAAVRRRVGLAEILTPVTFGTIIAWPFLPFRFVLTTLPFALYYLASGVVVLARPITRRDGWTAGLAGVVLLIGVSVVGNVAYIRQLHGPPEGRPVWQRLFDDHLDVIRWTRDHVPADQIVAATNPAFVYLYDGHRTVGYWQPNGTWAEWRRLGVHYLVDMSYLDSKDPSLPEGRYPTVYRSATSDLRVLDLQRIYEPH